MTPKQADLKNRLRHLLDYIESEAKRGFILCLDQELSEIFGIADHEIRRLEVTSNLADCRNFVRQVLPNFWVSSGTCELTGHASMGPDYNGAARERLLKEWDPDKYDRGADAGFNADLAPGADDNNCTECLAILHCAIQAWGALKTGERIT